MPKFTKKPVTITATRASRGSSPVATTRPAMTDPSPAPEPVEVQIHLPDEPRRDWPLEARLNGVVGRYAWNAEDQTWEGARAATTWPKIVARCLAWEFDLYSVPPTSGVAA